VSARALLSELRQRGILLETDGEKLRVDAPADAITEERRAALKEHKQGLMKLLQWEREREYRKLEEAGRRGLLVRWSQYPEWIKLHDPLSGEWHEVKATECLPGVVETANKHRKRGGVA
jgi:TubC N-terminal docking domain